MGNRLAALAVCAVLLGGDVRPAPPTIAPPDYANMKCFTHLHINGRTLCRLIVYRI